MEPERNEVYERIPWETLEEAKPDRQWLVFGIAGAIVLGALAYSFTSNRPAAMPVASTPPPAGSSLQSVVPSQAAEPPVAAPPIPSTAPVVTAEADLYAVHPERLIDRVAAHAEWFVAEYLTVDGSEESRATLTALLPAGVPLPAAPEDARVFVEWVRATEVEEIGPLDYRVTVLARSLSASGEEAYSRQPALEISVDVSMATEAPQVMTAPRVAQVELGPSPQLSLETVPDDVAAAALELSGAAEVVGGTVGREGEWEVIVLATGRDGVTRPVSVVVP
jgi:hypothetical protein